MSINRRIVEWPPSGPRWMSRQPEVEQDDEYYDNDMLEREVVLKAREIFRSSTDLTRLRSASGWLVSSTPRWATYHEFWYGHHATWGIAAEALALVFYHMATFEHAGGDEIEKYWRAVDYYFEKICRNGEDQGLWHKDGEAYRGNPTTADVVFRAVNHAHQLDADIGKGVREASRRAFLQEVASRKAREAAAKAKRYQYMDLED